MTPFVTGLVVVDADFDVKNVLGAIWRADGAGCFTDDVGGEEAARLAPTSSSSGLLRLTPFVNGARWVGDADFATSFFGD